MSRPVFVPSGKRRTKQPQRFHGAFTGGFSAGYFNSVDTKDGWKPSQNVEPSVGKSKPQKMEDFMDEQDFNEWGGPTCVKQDFSERPAATASIFSMDPPPNVGRRLLRILGWRDGDAAYVPNNEITNTTEDPTAQFLTKRKLKRIQFQQTLVKLPTPKLDTCGLGYDAFLEAPEFQKHREHVRRKAQARTNAVTNKTGSNVYRLSDLTGNTIEKEEAGSDDEKNHDISQIQDFVGTKSVGGFALREDDDDVYDTAPLDKSPSTFKIDKEQYDLEIYDHNSDDENNLLSNHDVKHDVGEMFSSWATKTSSSTAVKDRGITSDGRPPIAGFVLGGVSARTAQQRYPGPDIPHNFELKRHVFNDNEYPESFRSESVVERMINKVQQTAKIEKRKEEPKGAMAGANFVGLAAAMKNRFSAPKSAEENTMHPAGLHVPVIPPAPVTPQITVPAKEERNPIKVIRKTMLFVPEPLLCKRFHVKPPDHAKSTKRESKQGSEVTFFEKEVMMHTAGATAIKAVELHKDETEDTAEIRPNMKVYQSIFQPESDSSSSDSDSDQAEDQTKTCPLDIECNPSVLLPPKPTGVPRPSELEHSDPFQSTSTLSPSFNMSRSERTIDKSDDRKKKKKKEDRKKRRRRSSDDDSSTDSDDRRQRRKEKKRQKKERHRKISVSDRNHSTK